MNVYWQIKVLISDYICHSVALAQSASLARLALKFQLAVAFNALVNSLYENIFDTFQGRRILFMRSI